MPRLSSTALTPFLVLVALAVLACEAADPTLVSPEASGTAFKTVIVEAEVREADSALAKRLGWEGGVPGAEIHYREHGTDEWLKGRTDSTGQLTIDGLPPALWHVYGGRILTDAEAEKLNGKVRAFGDGLHAQAGGGPADDTTRLRLELFADRPKGLVISEFASGIVTVLQADVGGKEAARYIEIYNNSDRSIPLAGKLLADGDFLGFFPTTGSTCADSEAPRTDPSGLLTREVARFPPASPSIAPGEAMVIAGAAVDHTETHPDYPDLSDADFELAVGGVADNAQVPNMEQAGLELFSAANFVGGDDLWFLAEPTDVKSLPIVHRDHTGRGYVRIPADKILDAVGSWFWWPENEREDEFGIPCQPLIHPRFDRHFTYDPNHAVFGLDVEPFSSLHRRILRTEGGRAVLLNTNTSGVDFRFHRPQSPGWVPAGLEGGIGIR